MYTKNSLQFQDDRYAIYQQVARNLKDVSRTIVSELLSDERFRKFESIEDKQDDLEYRFNIRAKMGGPGIRIQGVPKGVKKKWYCPFKTTKQTIIEIPFSLYDDDLHGRDSVLCVRCFDPDAENILAINVFKMLNTFGIKGVHVSRVGYYKNDPPPVFSTTDD